MDEKQSLAQFVSDIDKIISGDSIIFTEHEDEDKEYRELLFLAKLLFKVDYPVTSKGRVGRKIKKVILNIQATDELKDDELDMVAGGANLNEMFDNENKKSLK